MRPTTEDDAEIEAAVLRQVLDHHPAHASVEELVRELADDPESFGERDAVERAVGDLVRAGLLHRSGELVFPTLAALRFEELLG